MTHSIPFSILAIWNLCWAVFASFLVDIAGRRTLFLVSCGGMVLFFIGQTICSAEYAIRGSAAAGHAVIAFIFLFYAAYEYVCCFMLYKRPLIRHQHRIYTAHRVVHGRDLTILNPCERLQRLQLRRVLGAHFQPIRQPYCIAEHCLEILRM